MKKNKLILGAIMLFVAFMFTKCTNQPKSNQTATAAAATAAAVTSTPTSFYYKIFKVGNGASSTALDSKNKLFVRINNGSFHQIFYGGENDVSTSIACPTSPNYVSYILYFPLVRSSSPYDTMDRDYIYDTIFDCNADLYNITPSTDYFRKGSIVDSVYRPNVNYQQQIVMWPPTHN